MPLGALKSFSRSSGKSLSTIERYWDEAKSAARKKGGVDNIYAYAMGIVKRRLGLESEALDDHLSYILEMIERDLPLAEGTEVQIKSGLAFHYPTLTGKKLNIIEFDKELNRYVVDDDGRRRFVHKNDVEMTEAFFSGQLRFSPTQQAAADKARIAAAKIRDAAKEKITAANLAKPQNISSLTAGDPNKRPSSFAGTAREITKRPKSMGSGTGAGFNR